MKQTVGQLRIGIIGAGNIGSAHISNIMEGLCPELRLTAVSDGFAQRAAWLTEQIKAHDYTDVAFFTDTMQLLDSGLVDGCIICTPHFSHPEIAMECMKRSIHVMVEKPAGVYLKQVQQMNEEAKKHPEVVFGMMFVERTNPVYRKMHELVHSGRYGSIRRSNFMATNWYRSQSYYDSGGWRGTWAGEGGGLLINQCPHQLDLWQWICGMPKKVHSHIHFGKWHDIEVEDDVTAYVEYENGATGLFVSSSGDAHGTIRLEIQMDKAKLLYENGKLRVWEYETTEQEFSKTNKTAFATVPAKELALELAEDYTQHIGVLNAWAGAILRGENLIAHGSEGIFELTLSNAMHLSAWLSREIELPFDADLHYSELQKRMASSRKKEEVFSEAVDLKDTYGGVKPI